MGTRVRGGGAGQSRGAGAESDVDGTRTTIDYRAVAAERAGVTAAEARRVAETRGTPGGSRRDSGQPMREVTTKLDSRIGALKHAAKDALPKDYESLTADLLQML